MFLLWPGGIIQHNNVFLFLSDAASYMIKADRAYKVLYLKMVHVTCLAHAMHRISEDICVKFPGVVKLISRVKRVFLKAPSCTVLFRTEAPDISLPPETILTYCRTWICATSHHYKYFKEIHGVLLQLDWSATVYIKVAKLLFNLTWFFYIKIINFYHHW